MIIIKLEKQYNQELKEAYQKGYEAGIDNHDLQPQKAFELIQTFARGYSQTSKKVDLEQINKLIDIVTHSYKLVPKDDQKVEEVK